ncbi:site-specific integrase [Niallia sp. NCCP-28]|uniref:site-specific integrase n=1 Tax=Niallia sp. NCCP-28 TaxID=2934712 RepID=UPI002080F09B|nr:site-specific integrase [Niallia sp. NCCP-28]GKU84150.1 integrase [Niallia sp. NCCP-28]
MLVPKQKQFLSLNQKQKEKIHYYISQSKSENTKKSYSADWKHFTEWCTFHNVSPLPASVETICFYLTELAETHKFSTIRRRLSSISEAHKLKQHISPTKSMEVVALVEGIKREKGSRQKPKKALMLPILPKLIDQMDTTTIAGIRDKAIILLGFALASRRSELVALNIEDLEFHDFGVDVRVRETKTKNDDLIKGVIFSNNEYCPVKATEQWIEAANLHSGALFRSIDRHQNINGRLSDKWIALIIKKYIEAAGLNPKDFAGHSLRSGLSTSAAMMGMTDISIMKQTGHKTREMVDRYVQAGQRYKNNASSILKNL